MKKKTKKKAVKKLTEMQIRIRDLKKSLARKDLTGFIFTSFHKIEENKELQNSVIHATGEQVVSSHVKLAKDFPQLFEAAKMIKDNGLM